MEPYNSRLPNFTAEASLWSSKNARDDLVYIPKNYPMQDLKVILMAEKHVDPSTWCDEETPCDPVTHTRTTCRWRDDLQDCICSIFSCTPNCHCYDHDMRILSHTEGTCLRLCYSWCCSDSETGILTCKKPTIPCK